MRIILGEPEWLTLAPLPPAAPSEPGDTILLRSDFLSASLRNAVSPDHGTRESESREGVPELADPKNDEKKVKNKNFDFFVF